VADAAIDATRPEERESAAQPPNQSSGLVLSLGTSSENALAIAAGVWSAREAAPSPVDPTLLLLQAGSHDFEVTAPHVAAALGPTRSDRIPAADARRTMNPRLGLHVGTHLLVANSGFAAVGRSVASG
jgi:hypothetical protein